MYEKMPTEEYYAYKKAVEDIERYGEKSDLERLYAGIIVKYGYCEELRDIDKCQTKWNVNIG